MILDIIYLIFALSGFIYGYNRGLIHSVFSVIALIAGLIASLKFTHVVSESLYQIIPSAGKFIPLIAFLLIFVATLFVIRLIARMLEKFLGFIFLGWINKLTGGLLWLFLATVLASTILWFVNQVNLIPPEVKASSLTYNYIEPFAPIVLDQLGKLLPIAQGLFDQIESLFEEMTRSTAHT